MRNFRTAAVAAATAVTVAFGGTVVASAETANTNEGTSTSTENSNEDSSSAKDTNKDSSSSSSFLSELGYKWGAWQKDENGKLVVTPDNKVTGEDMWGKETDPKMPEWASNWKTGVITLGVSSVIGAIIGAYNFAVYNNIVPAHLLDPIFRR
ncbi:hypothetical protein [Corynebacterium sp. HMSC059E07]|uniref:hypothetical protein n=1 Tax=Corynebacterium sp. HMSC059E07 TaxID=1739471 RepID=UPI0008A1D4FF|nr:hypothetical protein [Corynebacterium sp. HMSC059E07]OFP87504.1 hypothetical protein HMPREF2967_09275 [Corynebacterium sp. HMSC059E07]